MGSSDDAEQAKSDRFCVSLEDFLLAMEAEKQELHAAVQQTQGLQLAAQSVEVDSSRLCQRWQWPSVAQSSQQVLQGKPTSRNP